MDPRILAELASDRYVLQAVLGDMTAERVDAIVKEARSWLDGHPDSSLTTARFTAFDELTAELFAHAIRVLATFMPNSGI